jgi:hypothetical protein
LEYKITQQLGEVCNGTDPVVRASWELRRSDGVIQDQGTTEDEDAFGGTETVHGIAREIGHFDGENNASYFLDVNVIANGSRLNPGHPYLCLGG